MLKSYRNKVKELQNKNLELEKIIKTKLGLLENEVLPVNWEEELVKKTEAEDKYTEEKLAKEQALQEKEELARQLEEAKAGQKVEIEIHSVSSEDSNDYETEVKQQIKQLQEEISRLEAEKRVLEGLLEERRIECREISSQLEKSRDLEEPKKARLEGELVAAEKDKVRLETKLVEIQQKIQVNKKEETLLSQKRRQGSSPQPLANWEKTESEEKILQKKYPGLFRLMGEAKGKLKSDEYKWLIKVFEAQEELINLENQDPTKLKSSHHHQEISEAKWKLRSFQSKLKKGNLGDIFARSKELIEKQIKSQRTGSSSVASSSHSVRQQRLSTGESQRKAQQEVNLPRKFPH